MIELMWLFNVVCCRTKEPSTTTVPEIQWSEQQPVQPVQQQQPVQEKPIQVDGEKDMNVNISVDISKWTCFRAGRLSERLKNWRRLTSDWNLLKDIKGYKIEMIEVPEQNYVPREIRFSDEEKHFLNLEIGKLLEKGVIEECGSEDGEFISNVFLREKRDKGKYRMILNLKKLNKKVEYQHFKMDTLMSALGMVTPNCFFTSLDFKDAYYTVSVAEEDRKFFKFKVNDILYQFTCVPNGLSTGPRLFTKLLKVPLSHLRKEFGITITGYLDDTLLISEDFESGLESVRIASDLLQDLGFMISVEKSVVNPTRKIELLGFVIDSVAMNVTMIKSKAEKVQEILREVLLEDRISIRRGCKIIGMLVATMPCNPWAALKSKNFERCKLDALLNSRYDYDGVMSVTDEVKQDLVWWIDNIQNLQAPIMREKPHEVIYTDASLQGWGCYYPKTEQKFGGRWLDHESKNHINVLELKAIYWSLKSLMGDRSNIHVRVMTDNTTAMIGITKQGSLQSRSCNRVVKDIWEFAMARKIWVSTAHCPGVDNCEADTASRKFNDETEWSLDTSIYEDCTTIFGIPEVDLFATRLNHKCQKYVSWKPDPKSIAIDSFTIDWSEYHLAYAFPTFAIIPMVLQKIYCDEARVLMVVPYWPTRTWFTRFVEMLESIPILISVTDDVLYLPFSKKVHPLSGKMRLLVGICSGKVMRSKGMRQMLYRPSSSQKGKQLKNRMRFIGESGEHFVVNNRLICLDQVLVKV